MSDIEIVDRGDRIDLVARHDYADRTEIHNRHESPAGDGGGAGVDEADGATVADMPDPDVLARLRRLLDCLERAAVAGAFGGMGVGRG